MAKLQVLVIGEEPGELSALDANAFASGDAIDWIQAADCQAGLQRLSGGVLPDVIVLCEARPGLWTEAALDALRRAAPLVPLVRLSGSWCEGQARSGRPPSGCPSIAWQNWRQQGPNAASNRRAGGPPIWAHPTTATPEERLLPTLGPLVSRGILQGKVAISATSAAAAGALEAFCRTSGLEAVVLRPGDRRVVRDARGALWDTEPRLLRDGDRIAQLKAQVPGARLIALAGFPRSEDVAAARRAGVAAVVSKPFLVNDLLDQLAAGQVVCA